jgi:hypothetical protein
MGETDTTKNAGNPSKDEQEVSFKYVKSNFFRVIHADGAWGGLSPRGDIHISFYNERVAIPDTSRFIVSEGEIVKPEEYKASSKLVREVEADVIVDLTAAKSLRAWLTHKIDALEALIKEAQEETVNSDDQKKANVR